MKKFLLPAFFLGMLFSCQKDEMADLPPFESTLAPVLLSSFTGASNGQTITLQFTTSRQRNVSYYLLYSGSSKNELCPVGKIASTFVENGKTTYHYTDATPKGDPTYYMIGYTCKDSSYNFCEQVLEVGLGQKATGNSQ